MTARTVRPLRMIRPLVEAAWEGQKTQTRRVITAGNSNLSAGEFGQVDFSGATCIQTGPALLDSCYVQARCQFGHRTRTIRIHPRIGAGSLLWVREGQSGRRATRVGSRITLDVRAVRAERLQSIGDLDALHEGVTAFAGAGLVAASDIWNAVTPASVAHDVIVKKMPRRGRQRYRLSNRYREILLRGSPSPRDAFAVLWDYINGYGAWDSNPWVWVYHFKALPMNVDKLLERVTEQTEDLA